MSLEALWFAFGALSFAAYVVLDGFDLGAGIMHFVAGRDPKERTLIMRSIGPVWDGNEVWLLAAGATLYLAFPKLYAVAIAGFYLPVMILLWLLAARALGIEMKHHLHHPLWDDLWDAAFFGSSLLITLFLGVALGNVVRGVSLDESGRFFAPLWTNFRVGDEVGVLDWFTVSVGLTAVLGVALHGALWIAARIQGPPAERARTRVPLLAGATGAGLLVTSAGLVVVRPDLPASIGSRPLLLVLPAVALAGLAGAVVFTRRGHPARAFRASCAFLGAMVLTAAATIYPAVLPARVLSRSMLASAAKTSDYGLTVALYWWIPGILLACSYFVFLYRKLPRAMSLEDLDDHH